MRHTRRTPPFAYLVAVLATLTVTMMRLGLWELFGDRVPYMTFFAAVTFSAWYGGFGPGLLSTGLGAILADYYLLEPVNTFLIRNPWDAFGTVMFIGVGTMISRLGAGYHQAKERQRASQEELEREREAEEQLALAQKAGQMGSWQWDLKTNRLDWSPAVEALHGLEPGSFPRSLAGYQERVHAGDRARVVEAFETTLRHGADYAIEYRIIRPDGAVRWLEGRGRLFRDAAGAPTRMIAVCIDISERKRAEGAVFESEQRFGGFMEHLPGLAWIKDADGRYVYANDAALRAFHVPREELYGRTDSDLFPADRAEEFRRNDRRALESPDGYRAVETLVHEDGVVHHSVVNKFIIPQPDDAPPAIGGIAIDITEHKRAEAELQKQNLRLMLLGEAASQLLIADTTDDMLQGLFQIIGPHLGLDTYVGYLVTERGDGLRLVSSSGMPPEDTARFGLLRLGESVSGVVAQDRRPVEAFAVQRSDLPRDEGPRSAGLRAYVCYPLLTEGRLIGTLSFGSRTRDQFSGDDLGFMRTVSRYVTVASERLRLIEQLREADRRKDEFLATLAHELRNPLAPIRHALEIQRRSENDRDRIEQARGVMERQLEQLVRLIDDLLDVSRITRGKLELRMEPIELTTILTSAVEANRAMVDANRHTLVVELPDQPIHLHADHTRLSQVFQNLLNNAAKYTPGGGTIWLTARPEGETVRVSVRDTGVGIASDMLEYIFEMFAQGNRLPGREQDGGLGIGLTLVKRLVEMHGGTVDASSEGPAKGSTFTVRLPLAERPAPVAARANGQATGAPARRRILVADDNQESAESLALMLQLMGNEVHIAHDGDEAVRLAEAIHPEVAVLDIGMPRLNGYEAARLIRAYPWGRDLLLIALTGWGQESDKQRSEAAGFDHHLVKPVDPGQLERLLARETHAAHQ
jgi:PAS domain S-box-containing protein